MNLLIVESPIKARTIRKHLPAGDWQVLATGGHVRDLSQKGLGLYFRNGGKRREVLFDFKKIPQRSTYVEQIRHAAGGASRIYLGSDPDREGEAIAWHVSRMLGSAGQPASQSIQRISFNAVTSSAIQRALESPGAINLGVVSASLARRAIDRVIGYKVSPLATAALQRGGSDAFYGVGRVQAGALAILRNQSRSTMFSDVRRGYAVQASYSNGLHATCSRNFATSEMVAAAVGKAGGSSSHYLSRVKNGSRLVQASPPLTTARMIRSASRFLGWNSEKTMSVAQSLYHSGRITYPRTDSVVVSNEGELLAKSFIAGRFGPDYVGDTVFEPVSPYAQEAHECIRPTRIMQSPGAGDDGILFSIVQAHFIASQMSPAIVDSYAYEILGEGFPFEAAKEGLLFDGHLRMLPGGADLLDLSGPAVKEPQLLDLESVSSFELRGVCPIYGEASLIEDMERMGVGRPSTYASTVSNLIHHGYAHRDERKRSDGGEPLSQSEEESPFDLEDRGERLIEWLLERFRFLADPSLSREIEEDLDRIARLELSPEALMAERDALICDISDRVEAAVKSAAVVSRPRTGFVFGSVDLSHFGVELVRPSDLSAEASDSATLPEHELESLDDLADHLYSALRVRKTSLGSEEKLPDRQKNTLPQIL